MQLPNAIFPNETYLNGLRDADAVVVDALYNEFQNPVSRAVEFAGGSYADGGTFFRVAVLHTAHLVQSGKYPEEAPIHFFLKNLAVAQYHDWLIEKGQEPPTAPVPEDAEMAVIHALPSPEEMREMRLQIRAKRQYTRLSLEDQKPILSLANALHTLPPDADPSTLQYPLEPVARYKKLLNEQANTWESPLPAWAVVSLTDPGFHKIWSACEAVERRLASSQIPNSGPNKLILFAFIALMVLTSGFVAFTWFTRDQSPDEVYENNFNPPPSIMEDMAARYANDSVSVNRPEVCMIAFSEADEHYKNGDWREAAASLATLMNDSLAVCQSDALFYIAILGLQLDRPDLTLECIAKIEDLDRFGEEIYWYMALAYVKIAAMDPNEKDIARRAVERARSNTEIPERREQAEKMLEDLAE